MEASLVACVLAALLAMGACLQCEVCTAQGTNCTGSVETCAAGEDSCAFILTESTALGMTIQTFAKTCISSSQCQTNGTSVNFGTGMKMRRSIACCVGDACKTTTVPVPPPDTKPNGRSCPACYALNAGQCTEQTVACTGSETQCIDAAGSITTDGNQIKTIMKGCVSESICTQLQVGSWTVAGISANLITAKCTVANGAAGMAPGAARLLLPALAGLLLLQLLF